MSGDDGYAVTRQRVLDLEKTDPEDEEDTPPTAYAMQRALDFLAEVRPLVERVRPFPRATPVVGDSGGITFYWMPDVRSVQYTLPPTEKVKGWAYRRDRADDYSEVMHDVALDALACWLVWVQGGNE